MKLHIKSFTMIEMVVVVFIIWILMLWMTIYLDWTGERTKIIEAEWCLNSFWWVINNYLYYTLTSKNIKVWSDEISPKYYTIMLSWSNNCNDSGNLCDKILLWYITGDNNISNNQVYQTYNVWNTCNQSKVKLWFYRWSWNGTENNNYVSMNKWFLPLNTTDLPFQINLKINTEWERSLLWYIIVVLCIDKNCTSQRQIWRRRVDARSQTVPYEKCKFYDDNQLNICKTREGCTVYSDSDPTVCTSY